MKIRSGFVSNSSTSSFIVLVEEKYHNKVYENLHEYYKEFLPSVAHKKFLGKNIICFSGEYCSEDGMYLDNYDGEILDIKGNIIQNCGEDDDVMPLDILVGKYVNKLKEVTDDVIYITDCH